MQQGAVFPIVYWRMEEDVWGFVVSPVCVPCMRIPSVDLGVGVQLIVVGLREAWCGLQPFTMVGVQSYAVSYLVHSKIACRIPRCVAFFLSFLDHLQLLVAYSKFRRFFINIPDHCLSLQLIVS